MAKLETITIGQIKTSGEAMAKVAAAMIELASEMERIDMEEIRLSWNKRQWDAFDLMVILGDNIRSQSSNQLNAYQQNRLSIQEKTMQRTARDRAKKAEKRQAAGEETRPVGRPRKHAT